MAGRTSRWIAGFLAVSLALTLAACGGSSGGGETASAVRRERPRTARTTTTATPETAAPAAPAASGTSLVAQATPASMPVYAAAGDSEPSQSLDNPNENGAPLVFLVKEQHGDWLNVYLPVRPNGSTGWIRAADAAVVSNGYSIDIALGAHRLVVHNGEEIVLDEPIGVGTAQTPTPGGIYYIEGAVVGGAAGGFVVGGVGGAITSNVAGS